MNEWGEGEAFHMLPEFSRELITTYNYITLENEITFSLRSSTHRNPEVPQVKLERRARQWEDEI